MDRNPLESSPAVLPSLPAPGEILDGKYRIERSIGQGAMAAVLEATHLRLDDRVAIKVLLPQWAKSDELVERFLREGRAATRIRSEHVVRVFDVAMVERTPYLVMEYLDGRDLDRLINEGGALPPALAVEYLLQASEAIAEAHVSGVIHRDLKPANLFLTRRADGSPCIKVLDFGISKVAPKDTIDTRATQPTAVLGSPHYMSPEQMQSSRDVDVRSDIWALGAILFELVAGRPAFDADTLPALSAAILRDPPASLSSIRPDAPPALEAAIMRCLDKDPARRFQNVAELAWALAELGGPNAIASAERIARVLEAGPGAVSVPRPPMASSEVKPLRAMLDSPSLPPPRARTRMFGYVVGGLALSAVAIGVGSMIVEHKHEIRDAEQREEAEHADAAVSSSLPVITSASVAPPPPPVNASASANASAAPPTSVAAAPTHVAPKPPVHPRPARPVPPKKPGKKADPNAPLPDFPVPPVPASEQGTEPK